MRIYRARSARVLKRGFTLVELAIVVGICGLIIGAIFAASSAPRRSLNADEVTSQLAMIVDNVRSYYNSRAITADEEGGIAACTGAGTDIKGTGIFPTHVNSPTKTTVTANLCTETGAVFIRIRYAEIPVHSCYDVVMSSSFSGRDMGLSKMVIKGHETQTLTLGATDAGNINPGSGLILPSSPKLINSCKASGSGSGNIPVEWYYKLRQ